MTIFPSRDRVAVYLVQIAGFPGNSAEALRAFHSLIRNGDI
jgi:hypothetical protein